MKQSLLERNSEDASQPPTLQPAQSLPSYRQTQWALVNCLLDIVDTLTGGRAGLFQRFFLFAFIGGFAALVNMAVFWLVFYVIPWPTNIMAHNVLASVLAAEISIMANF